MGLLSDDFFDNWVDWKVELYSAISKFSMEPCEEHHDTVVRMLTEHAGDEVSVVYDMPSTQVPVIAVCNANRKRDALAIMGPIANTSGSGTRYSYNFVNTWKCSKHTPQAMRGVWKERKYSHTGAGLYINRTPKFMNEHTIYRIPMEVYEALTTQFKQI